MTSEPEGIGPSGLSIPAVWANVPQRNKYFTGREGLLRDLRQRIIDHGVTALLPHTLYGMGGVGKTQLAVEYTYLFQSEYDLVWWVSADQPTLVRPALAALARKLNLPHHSERVDETVELVLEALRRGEPYRRWLLVFDNADQPDRDIRDLMPHGPGHVLVTSRERDWESVADALEVDVFARAESLEFLKRRRPEIADSDGGRLAKELGDLPLALEQAVAFMDQTATSASAYLDLLATEAGKVLGENRPKDYPLSLWTVLNVSVSKLADETPRAMGILSRCAFFGAEPISLDLLKKGEDVLDSPLAKTLGDPYQFGRAIRALSRYSLIRVDHRERTLGVHRLLQRAVRERLDSTECAEIVRDVHLLLAAADPGEPDDPSNWPAYAKLLAHVRPSGAATSDQPRVRRLVRGVVRYLYVVGAYSDARRFAELALDSWVNDSGEDDPDVLVMNRHLGTVEWAVGDYRAAYKLNRRTLDRMRVMWGEDHEETLMLLNMHGADLRVRGEFAKARALDENSVQRHRHCFGDDHPRTFMAIGNLADDYKIGGDYHRAVRLHDEGYQARLNFYGRDDHPAVLFAQDNLARALRHAGKHAAARNIAERVYRIYQEIVQQGVLPENHPSVLRQAKSLSVTRRVTGMVEEALELAGDVYERYQRAEGDSHPDTLAAAVALANAQRMVGDLHHASALLEDTLRHYGNVLGTDHPYTYAASLNLAIVRRLSGEAMGARALFEEVLVGLEHHMGRDHDYTLSCATNLASALADLNESEEARDRGDDTLRRFRATLGENNPNTLACAGNLALDLKALGQDREAADLFAHTLQRYRETLSTDDHPAVLAVTAGRRLDLDVDPPPL